MLDHLLAVCLVVGLVENEMDKLDVLVRDISRAQSAAFPVHQGQRCPRLFTLAQLVFKPCLANEGLFDIGVRSGL
jgi:hypothetical protein